MNDYEVPPPPLESGALHMDPRTHYSSVLPISQRQASESMVLHVLFYGREPLTFDIGLTYIISLDDLIIRW